MQIVAGRHQALRANYLACRLVPVSLRILHPFDKHGSVHGQIQSIQRKQRCEPLQKLRFDLCIGLARNRPAWNGCSYQSRKKGRTVPFQKLKTLILYRLIAAKDREVFHPGSDTAVRARLNADAAESDPRGGSCPHIPRRQSR